MSLYPGTEKLTAALVDSVRRMFSHAQSESLRAGMFKAVSIDFKDGSFAFYRHAIIMDDPMFEAFVWLFTEHEGYLVMLKQSIERAVTWREEPPDEESMPAPDE